jgi:hypothetical protein
VALVRHDGPHGDDVPDRGSAVREHTIIRKWPVTCAFVGGGSKGRVTTGCCAPGTGSQPARTPDRQSVSAVALDDERRAVNCILALDQRIRYADTRMSLLRNGIRRESCAYTVFAVPGAPSL